MKIRLAVLCVAVAGAVVAGTSGAGPPVSGTFSYFDFGSAQNPPTQRLLKQYQKTHPNIHIKFVNGPSSNSQAWMVTQLAGGTAPDTLTLSTNEQPWRDLNKGWWNDLSKHAMDPDPYVKGNKHWIDLFTRG